MSQLSQATILSPATDPRHITRLGQVAPTSGTSVTLPQTAAASVAFTVPASLAPSLSGVGAKVRAFSQAAPSKWLEGAVASYSGTTLTLTVTASNGSGAVNDWAFCPSTLSAELAALLTPGTSVSSLAIATGSKAFTTQAGLGLVAGMRLRALSSAAPTADWMEGYVASYSGTALVLTVDAVGGSGTHADWSLTIAGSTAGNTAGNTAANTTGNTAGNTAGNTVGNTVGNTTGNTAGNTTGNTVGNTAGNQTGNTTGNTVGNTSGNQTGNTTGNTVGNTSGNQTGNTTGNTVGNTSGNQTGNTVGNTAGNQTGNTTGNTSGNTTGNTAGNNFASTSATSLAIGTGTKTFTTQAGLPINAGTVLRASSSAAPTVDFLLGTVTSYSGTTLVLSVASGDTGGSGTHADWLINLAGLRGLDGVTTSTLWVDAAGSDANAGTLARPLLTLGAAKAAAASGTLIHVGPGTYAVTGSILKNGVNWHFEPGAIVTKTVSSGNVGILDDQGAAITSVVSGRGVFAHTSSSSATGQANVRCSHADSNLSVTARKLTQDSSVNGGLPYPTNVHASNGSLFVEADEIIQFGGASLLTNVWWEGGKMLVRAGFIGFSDTSNGTYSIWTNATADSEHQGVVVAGQCDGVYAGSSATSAVSAFWVQASVLRGLVQNDGANRIYVSAQKIFGSIFNTGSGQLYVEADKLTPTGTAPTDAGIGNSGSGSLRVNLRHFDPSAVENCRFVSNTGTGLIRVTGAAVTASETMLPALVAGGQTILRDCDIDMTAALGADAVVTISGITQPSGGVGAYCDLFNTGGHFVPWFNIDGSGSAPAVSGTPVQVTILSTDDNNTVAAAVAAALAGKGWDVAVAGNAVTLTDQNPGAVTSSADVNTGFGLTTEQGSLANGISVTGGALLLENCKVLSVASDIAQSGGGTASVCGGHGSGTNGNFTTSGSVAFFEARPLTGVPGDFAVSGTLTAGNFSGSSSGTNNGDQTNVSGNAGTATALQTARAINGVAFNGTAPITVPAAAGTLTGATLAGNVLASSLTGLGTVATGAWQATAIAATYGGTGLTALGTGVATGLGTAVNSGSGFLTATQASFSYQPLNVKISAIGALANGAGYLKNDGAGVFSYGALGTGIAAALAANAGSAGAPVLFNGAGGAPSSLDLTGATSLPVSGITASTVTALGVGSLELGHASDTTLTRLGAGRMAVESVEVATASNTLTLTGKSIAASQLTGAMPALDGSALTALTAANITNSTTVGRAILNLTNPSAIGFVKIAADNTVSHRTPAQVLSDIGADNASNLASGTAAVTIGGTGRQTGTTAYALLAAGTTATGAQQTLAKGLTTEILVGGGASALDVWTTAEGTGAPLRKGSPAITTPTIADFTNSTHSHQNAAGGGSLDAAAIGAGNLTDGRNTVANSTTTSLTGAALQILPSTTGTMDKMNLGNSTRGSIACTTLNANSSITLTGGITCTNTFITTPATLAPTLNGGAAVSIAVLASALAVNGVNALTLANGTNGQIITVNCTAVTAAGTATVTPTTANGFTTFAYNAAGQSVTLRYHTTGGWVIQAVRGATVA